MNSTNGASVPQPLLSVALPCHKPDALLDRALASCRALAGRSDIEIIVSWNSTDNVAFEQLRRQYPGFKWLRPHQPLGMGANWDFCLQHAQGEWGLVLSYDDQLLPDQLLNLLPRLANLPDEVGSIFGLAAIEDAVLSPPKLIYPKSKFKPRLWYPPDLWRRIPWGTPVHLPAAIFRRKAWQASGGFDNGLAFACDAGLWERLCWQYAVWTIPDFWSIYRWHGYSVASARASHEDVRKQAGIFRSRLANGDLFGRLVCHFGYSRQERLAVQMNADYAAELLKRLSPLKRVMWRGRDYAGRLKIGPHLVNRLIFRILLGLWQITRRRIRS